MAALIGVVEESKPSVESSSQQGQESLDGIPIFDNRPIDFSGGADLDGEPIVSVNRRWEERDE